MTGAMDEEFAISSFLDYAASSPIDIPAGCSRFSDRLGCGIGLFNDLIHPNELWL